MKIASFIILCLLVYFSFQYYWEAQAISAKDILHVNQKMAELAMEKCLWCAGFAVLDGLLFLFLLFFD